MGRIWNGVRRRNAARRSEVMDDLRHDRRRQDHRVHQDRQDRQDRQDLDRQDHRGVGHRGVVEAGES